MLLCVNIQACLFASTPTDIRQDTRPRSNSVDVDVDDVDVDVDVVDVDVVDVDVVDVDVLKTFLS